MRFSDRIGVTVPETTLQIEDMDPSLANMIWETLSNGPFKIHYRDGRHYHKWYRTVHVEFFKKTSDSMPSTDRECYNRLRSWFFEAIWWERYNFVQFTADMAGPVLIDHLNRVLKAERSAYRFVGRKLVPITNSTERATIEEVLEAGDKFSGARLHIKRALTAFGKRPEGDFVDAIRESIHAVESTCKVLLGDNNATLSGALKRLDKSHQLHPALKKAFSNLYGYTSDEDGIRHAMMDGAAPVRQEDAQFMIVACSAFINYLTAKSQT